MRIKAIIITSLCIFLIPCIGGCKKNRENGIYAEIETDKGTMVAKLFHQQAPITVSNFIGLAEGSIQNNAKEPGAPFYDGLTFHRVVPDFVIQGGCPKGDGTGNPGYNVPDEILPELKHGKPGILAMANAGLPHSNGCQFYITLKPLPDLDGRYSVFGELVEGLDVPGKIAKGDRIRSIKISRTGDEARSFKIDNPSFRAMLEKRYKQLSAEIENKIAAQEKKLQEQWPDLEKTESGLMYKTLKTGSGPVPEKGDTVHVNYVGRLADGTEFDSSLKHGKPISFPIGENRVIRGWEEALITMRPGEKRVLVIHPKLGYGAKGASNVIPPYSYLVFEVELMKIDKTTAKE